MQTAKVAILISLAAAPVSAQDLSYQISGNMGSFSNMYGGYGSSAQRGIGGSYDRDFVDLNFSVATELVNGDTFVFALNRSQFDVFSSFNVPDENFLNLINFQEREKDATAYTTGATFRYLRDRNGYTFGGFAGVGIHNDYGDWDGEMGYAFMGADVSRETQFGGIYVQAGMLDANPTDYSEGIQDAPFINFGGRYELGNEFTLTGSVGYAGGKQGVWNAYKMQTFLSDSNLFNARIGLERNFGNMTGSIGYEITHTNSVVPEYITSQTLIDFPFGDTFEQFYVGFKYEFGAKANHGSPLPSFGNWIALSENELEMPF